MYFAKKEQRASTFHVHLAGLHNLLVDHKLWQCFEECRGWMNEHRLVYKRRLLNETKKLTILMLKHFRVFTTTDLVAILPFWI